MTNMIHFFYVIEKKTRNGWCPFIPRNERDYKKYTDLEEAVTDAQLLFNFHDCVRVVKYEVFNIIEYGEY